MSLFKKPYRHLDTLTALFVAILIISNIASVKMVDLKWFTFDGGTLLFPLSYIFGDILTEVYGYKASRKVIWLGFFCATLMAGIFYIVGALPPDTNWPNQESYMLILGQTPRIVLGSLVAFFCGGFSNSFILAKMKILTKGKWLWMRTIGSTLVGEGIDTLLFVFIAFYGIFPMDFLWTVILSNYIFKTGVEILFTPITYLCAKRLKKAENEDYYDTKTNFNPFNTHHA